MLKQEKIFKQESPRQEQAREALDISGFRESVNQTINKIDQVLEQEDSPEIKQEAEKAREEIITCLGAGEVFNALENANLNNAAEKLELIAEQDIFDPDVIVDRLDKIQDQGASEQEIEYINNIMTALKEKFEESEFIKNNKKKNWMQKKLEKATDSIASFLTSKWIHKSEKNRKKAKIFASALRTVGILAGAGTGMAIAAEMIMPGEAEAMIENNWPEAQDIIQNNPDKLLAYINNSIDPNIASSLFYSYYQIKDNPDIEEILKIAAKASPRTAILSYSDHKSAAALKIATDQDPELAVQFRHSYKDHPEYENIIQKAKKHIQDNIDNKIENAGRKKDRKIEKISTDKSELTELPEHIQNELGFVLEILNHEYTEQEVNDLMQDCEYIIKNKKFILDTAWKETFEKLNNAKDLGEFKKICENIDRVYENRLRNNANRTQEIEIDFAIKVPELNQDKIIEIIQNTYPQRLFSPFNLKKIKFTSGEMGSGINRTPSFFPQKTYILKLSSLETRISENPADRAIAWKDFFRTLSHEGFHSGDSRTNNFLSMKDRIERTRAVIDHINNENSYKSAEMGSNYGLHTFTTERPAFAIEEYLDNPNSPSLSKDDKELCEKFIKQIDPDFNAQLAAEKRNKIIQELQKQSLELIEDSKDLVSTIDALCSINGVNLWISTKDSQIAQQLKNFYLENIDFIKQCNQKGIENIIVTDSESFEAGFDKNRNELILKIDQSLFEWNNLLKTI